MNDINMGDVLRLLEVGTLFMESDEQFNDYYNNTVYGGKYGYSYKVMKVYRESEMADAISAAKSYVKNGAEKTYAVITNQGYMYYESDDINDLIGLMVRDGADVVYCVAKINGQLVENFII